MSKKQKAVNTNSNTRNDDTTEPIFRVKPSNYSNHSELQHVGYMREGDKLGDEIIPIETPAEISDIFGSDTFYYGEVVNHDITINAFRSNLVGSYVVKTINYPVYSLSFMYKKSIAIGYLFDIYLSLTLDQETLTRLGSIPSYVNAKLTGTYMITIQCDEEMIQHLKLVYENVEKSVLEDLAIEKVDLGKMSESELLDMIETRKQEKIEFYDMLFKGKIITDFTTQKKFMNDVFFPIMKSKHLRGLIEFALQMRRKKRQVEYGAYSGEYSIPKNVRKSGDVIDDSDSDSSLD